MTRSPQTAVARSRRRASLFARTALSGALGAVALGAAPQAWAGPIGGASPAAVAKAPTISTSSATTTVKLNQSNTIIDWKSFDISKGESVDFLFGSNSGVVLNRVNGAASIDGALKGCVVTCQVIGGNVWLYASNGVVFGPNARVDVGSLLATTTPLASDMSFLSGATGAVNFQGGLGGAKIDVAAGAELAAHGGSLALIAPEVDTEAGSSVTAKGTALLGAAQNFVVHFADGGDGAMDLIDFQVPVSALKDGSVSATPLSVKGAVAGGSVVLAAVSRPSVVDAVISLGGTITATGAKAGPGGDIVLTASGAPDAVNVGGTLNATRAVTLQAPDGGALDVSGQLGARDAGGQGGTITIGGAGTAATTIEAGALLDASSIGAGKLGGAITATGDALNVAGQVLARGNAGGGTISLGGGAHGQDAGIFDATTTTVGPTALIDASATVAGPGGRVTVWSNADTTYQGAILARGGAAGGDGGSAEVSGGSLAYQGQTDLRAPMGQVGTLLLDPGTVDIVPGSDQGSGTFTGGAYVGTAGNTATINDGTIDQQLTQSNVIIQAGTINFNNPQAAFVFDYATTTHGGNNITFSADSATNPFSFNTPGITANSGIGLTFQATSAPFVLPANVTITTVAAAGPGAVAGAISIQGVGTSGTAGITLQGSLNAGTSGNVTLNATTSDGSGLGAITEAGAGSISAGSLTFSGGAVGLASSSNLVGAIQDNSSATGGLNFTNGQSLTIGLLSVGGTATITTTAGDLQLNDPLAVTGNLTLTAAGILDTNQLTIGGNYTATAGTFNTTPGGAQSYNARELNPTFSPGGTGAFMATQTTGDLDLGPFANISAPGALTINVQNGAVVDNGATSLTGASVTVVGQAGVTVGAVTATAANNANSVTLTSPLGAIAQNAGTAITGGTLYANAYGGSVTLDQTQNNFTGLSVNAVSGAKVTDAFAPAQGSSPSGLSVISVSAGSGGLTLSNTGDIAFASNPLLSAGAAVQITSGGSVTFEGALALPFDTTVSATSGSVSFDGPVSGAYSLSASAASTGSVLFASTAETLNTLTVNGPAVVQNDVKTSGAITFNGPLTLGPTSSNAITVSSSGGGVTFGTIDDSSAGADALTVKVASNQLATFGGAVGGGTALGSLTVTGPASLGGDVATTGAIAFNGPLTLTPASGSAIAVTSSGGGATFGTIDDSHAGADALSVSVASNQMANFGGAVGGGTALGSLTVSGPATLAGNVTATGAITFNDALTLAPTTPGMIELAGGSVSVSTVDDPSQQGGDYGLDVSTPAGAFTASGALGGNSPLGGLELSAATATFHSTGNRVGTLSAQLTGGALSFTDVSADGLEVTGAGVTTNNQPISLAGASLKIDAPITVNNTSASNPMAVTLASTSPSFPVALALDATVNAGAGGVLNLSSGTTISQSTPFTAGMLNVSADGTVTLTQQNAFQTLASLNTSGDYNATVTSGSSLAVSGTVTAHGGALTLTGGGGLTIGSASTVTGGAVTLEGGGTSVEVDGSVTAEPATTSPATTPSGTGVLTIQDGSITLGASSVLTAIGGATLNATISITQNTGGMINAGSLAAAATGAIRLPGQNTVAAVTDLQGVGVSFNDASTVGLTLTASGSGSAISGGSGTLNITNAGPILVATTLSGTTQSNPGMTAIPGVTLTATGGGSVEFQDPYVLGGDTVVNAGSTVTFDGAVSSPAASGSNPAPVYALTSDTPNGSTILDGDVSTTGAISFGATTVEPALVSLSSTASSVTLGTLDGAIAYGQTLSVSAATGGFTVGQIGHTAALSGLGVKAPSVNFTSSANDIGVLAADVTGGGLTFNNSGNALTIGTVNGVSGLDTSTTNASATLSSGALTLQQNVNVGTGLLALNAGGSISQTGGAITASALSATGVGSVSLTQPNNAVATLATLNGTGASFNDAEDAGLTVVAANAMGGALAIQNTGSSQGQGGLTITAGSLTGSTVTLTSANAGVAFTNAAYTLGGDTTVVAASTVNFGGTVDGATTAGGPYGLTSGVSPGATTIFTGAVGGTTPLASLAAGASRVEGDITVGSGGLSLGATTLAPASGRTTTLSSAGGVALGTVDGTAANQTLFISAPSGAVSAGEIGAAMPLAGLGVDAQSAMFAVGDHVATLAADVATGGLSFDNGPNALTIGTVAGSGSNNVSGLTVPGQSLQLSAGSIAEGTGSGDVIIAGSLNAQANGAISLGTVASPVANVVATVVNLQGAGVSFTDAAAGGLSLDVGGSGGAISGGPGPLTISNTGPLTVASGTAVTSAGTIALTGAGLTLAPSVNPAITSSASGVTLTATGGGDLSIQAPVQAAANALVSLSATATAPSSSLGSITETDDGVTSGGAIAAGRLSVSGGVVTLTGHNAVNTLSLSATGAASFSNFGSLSVTPGALDSDLTLTVATGAASGDTGSLNVTAPLVVDGNATLTAAGSLSTVGENVAGDYTVKASTFTSSMPGPMAAALSPTLSPTSTFSVEQISGNVDFSQLKPTYTSATPVTGGLIVTADNGAISDTMPMTSITAGYLSATAGAGSVTLPAVTLNGSAGVPATGVATVTAHGGGIALDGDLTALGQGNLNQTVTLSANGGAITQTGAIMAQYLSAVSDTGITLNVANSVAEVTNLAVTGTAANANATLDDADARQLTLDKASVNDASTLTVRAPSLTLASGGTFDGGVITFGAPGAAQPGALDLNGSVNASGLLTLTASGAVQQDGGSLSGASITAQAGGNITLSGAVTASGLAAFTAQGGALNQAAGTIKVGSFQGSAQDGISLAALYTPMVVELSNNGSGTISATLKGSNTTMLGGAANAGAITMDDTGGELQLTGPVNAGSSGAVTLQAAALLDQTLNASISGLSLSAQGGAGVTLAKANNSVQTLTLLQDASGVTTGVAFNNVFPGVLTVGTVNGGGGGVSLTNAQGLSLTQAVIAGGAQPVTLSASNGAIAESGQGAITAASLSASGGSITLDGANAIGQVTALNASGPGGASLTDSVGLLTLVSANGGGGALSINNTGGAIALTGAAGSVGAGTPNDPQSVTLSASGVLSEDAGATINAYGLSATGAGVDLAQANTVRVLTQLADTDAGGAGASFVDTGSLTVDSATSAQGAVSLTSTSGGLMLSGTGVGAPGHTVTLTATQGGITQDAGGAVVAATLTGQAGTGFALSTAPGNSVGQILNVSSAGGTLSLADTVPLQVSGAVSAPTVQLSSTGAMTQDVGGVITASSLSASASGGLSLTGRNSVTTLEALNDSGAGGASFDDAGAGALNVLAANAGASGNLALTTAGALTISGPVVAGPATGSQTATLVAASVSEGMGGSLTAGVLTGQATGGDFVLGQGGNAFARLPSLSAPGAITLVDTQSLEVSGGVAANGALSLSAPSLTLDAGASLGGSTVSAAATSGAFGVAGTIASPGAVDLSAAGALTQTAGAITAGSFQGAAQGGLTLIALSTPTITSLSNSGAGDIDVALTGGATTSGALSNPAGAIALTAPAALAFTGAVSAGGLIQLTAQGGLTGVSVQSSGASVTLTGAGVDVSDGGAGVVSAASFVTVAAGAGNASFATLSAATGDVTVTGQSIGVSKALDVGQDLILTGASFSGVALAPTFAPRTGRDFLLNDTAGGLSFTNLYAPRNLVVVATDPGAGDSAPVSGGSLSAGTGSVTATATSIALSGGVSAPQGGVALTAGAGSITFGGDMVAGAQGVALTAAGAVVETGSGAIQAPTLSTTAGDGVSLGGANSVASVTLANAGGGGVLLVDGAPTTTVQSVTTGGGDIVLSETGGALVLASDLTSPGAISVAASGPLNGGALTAQGGAISASAQGLAFGGDITAAGGVMLSAGAGAANLQAVAAHGGDADLSGGAITVGDVLAQGSTSLTGAGPVATAALTASTGALNVSGAGLSFTTATAGTTAALTSTGAIAFDALTSGADATLAAGGALTGSAVTSTAGSVRLTAASLTVPTVTAALQATLAATAGDLAVSTLTSGGDANASATGAVTLGTASVGGDLTGAAGGLFKADTLEAAGNTVLSGGTLNVATIQTGGSLGLTAVGNATLGTATAGSDLSAQVGGSLGAQSLTATGGSASIQAAALSLGSEGAGGDIGVTTTGGDLMVGALSAGGDLTLNSAGAVAASTLSAGLDATLTSAGGLTAASIAVGRNLALDAGSDVAVTTLSSGPAGALSIAGRNIVLGAASGTPGAADRLSTGAATTVDLDASGQAIVDVTGPAALTRVIAGAGVDLATFGGDLMVGTLQSGGGLNASATGGSVGLGALAVAAGPLNVDATVDVVMGAGAAVAGPGMTLTAPAGALSVIAGRDALISYSNTFSPSAVTAGRNVYLASAAGSVMLASLTAGGNATVLGGSGLTLTQVAAGGSLTADARSGDAAVGTATVGGDLALTAEAGAAMLNAVDMTAAIPGVRTLTVSASGNAVLGGATDAAAPGALTLASPSETLVNVLSTGSTGGGARVDVTGGATLSEVAANSGAVEVEATGAVIGAPATGTLFSAGTTLTVVAGGAVTMGGQSTAGGQALVVSGGTLALDALTGTDVTLRADDLALTGLVKATQVCSPTCAAPTLGIESRTGLLTVGDAPSGATFASGGMTLDSGEMQRLQGDSVALYAGDTTNAAARGDLQVGSFTLNASAIKSLGLYAGSANVVRVAGTVTPATNNTGVLIIGSPDATSGWTPRSIYVSGALGVSSTLTTAAAALQSVSLNSVHDTLIGGPLFQSVVSAAEPADGGATAAINVTRGLPIGVQPTVADLNLNLITTGTLSLRSNGYIVQENTGSIGQQGGILLTNAAHQDEVLTLGRVSAAANGVVTPEVIDLSLNFYTASGGLITRQVVAPSPAIDLDDLARSDYYRINGCTIGSAGSCTPLPNTIVDIGIDKLVEGVQVANEDPEPTDDPTITGAGNEEIWRTPTCDVAAGQPCQ